MNKFLKKISTFSLSFIIFFSSIIYFFENNDTLKKYKRSLYVNSYNIILKKIKKYDKRKIIFIGGSNLAFGLDSKKVEQHLGIKAFNFGVHVGLGLKKPIDDISKHLNENDILIFSPEYENFNMYRHSSIKNIANFITGFNICNIVDINIFPDYIFFLKTSILNVLRSKQGSKYSLDWVNDNGDIIGHHGKKNTYSPKTYEKVHITLEELNNTKIYIDKNIGDIQYFILPPVTNKDIFTFEEMEQLNEKLTLVFKDQFPILIDQMIFDDDCFYDTGYHLNYDCKQDRTDHVIELLDLVINDSNS